MPIAVTHATTTGAVPLDKTKTVLVEHAGMKYPEYAPVNDPSEVFPEIEPFEQHDRACDADPALPVFYNDHVTVEPITPFLGVKVTGLDLASLDSAGLDQLALLTAQKGMVFFASNDKVKQTYRDVPMKRKLDISRYFGPLHKHAVTPRPKDSNEITVVYQDVKNTVRKNWWPNRLSQAIWHIDQSQESHPPGLTFFCCLQADAPAGGDTLGCSLTEAYRRFSPAVQNFLLGLKAVHSSRNQVAAAERVGGANRKPAIETTHPLIIEHPATKEKSLYFNPECVVEFEGLRHEENDHLFRFLNDHITKGQDFHARYKWNEGDICVWDQRVAAHSAVLDNMDFRRHFIRIISLSSPPKAAAP
ncbi:hypothetical protein Q5752_004376 [Cryptotrichosporon argae]